MANRYTSPPIRFYLLKLLYFSGFLGISTKFTDFPVLFLLKLSYFSGLSGISDNFAIFPVNWTIEKRVGPSLYKVLLLVSGERIQPGQQPRHLNGIHFFTL